jgi:hypothetical protein
MNAARFSLICGALLLISALVLGSLWLGRHVALSGQRLSETQREWVTTLADLPNLVRSAFTQVQVVSQMGVAPELLIPRASTEKSYWVSQFPAPEDNGYLLFSGVRANAQQTVIELIRIADGQVLQQWKPDLTALHNQRRERKEAPKGSAQATRFFHPLPLPDGSVVVNTSGSLIRFSACQDVPTWVLDEVLHHSNELDAQGRIVSNGVVHNGFQNNRHLQQQARDDALTWVSPDGQLVEQRAFSDILIENGLEALLLGFSRYVMSDDPIHLNQITPALTDGLAWRRGDLLISARHLSTVFLYRPSTNKIIWHQTGPWLNQHSVAFVGQQKIVVFSNHVYGADPKNAFLRPDDHNRVFLYDLITQEVSEPWQALLASAQPRTVTEGRVQVLADGGLFLEETNQGRYLRFSRDRLLWSWANELDAHTLGAVSWSRYLSPTEAQPLLTALAQCPNTP